MNGYPNQEVRDRLSHYLHQARLVSDSGADLVRLLQQPDEDLNAELPHTVEPSDPLFPRDIQIKTALGRIVARLSFDIFIDAT